MFARASVGLTIACTLLFGLSAARTVLGGDNGEFLAVMHLGGRAHPPGFPLYVALLRLFSWIPALSPAHAGALVNVLLGVATTNAMLFATRAWGARWYAGTLAVVTVAFSSLFWIQATHAEVFMLNALLAALILWASGPSRPDDGILRGPLLGGLAGLALCGHPTAVLLAPVGLLGLLRHARSPRVALLRLGLALVFALAVLGLYPVVLGGAPPQDGWAWGGSLDVSGVWSHMLREDYGTLSLGIYESEPVVGANEWALFASLAVGVAWIGLLPLALGLVGWKAQSLGHNPSDHITPSPLDLVVFAFSWTLSGVGFVAFFNLEPVGVARAVVERFHLLPLVVSVVPLARGIDAIAEHWRTRAQWTVFAIVAFAILRASISLNDVSEHHRPDVETYVHNVLLSVPEDSVLLGTGDHRLYAFLYVQEVLEERQDVAYIDVTMLLYPWYAERVESNLGFELEGVDHDEQVVHWPVVVSTIVARGRPLYVTNLFDPDVATVLPLVPHGVVQRVATPDNPSGPLESVVRLNAQLFATYEYPDGQPSLLSQDPTSWSHLVREDYARSWRALALALEAAGREADAAWARDRTQLFAPNPP